MKTVYVFTEERSAAEVVEAVANRCVPAARIIAAPHSGKSELEKLFPRRLRNIVHPKDARFIILRDNDGSDCSVLKRRLLADVPGDLSGRVRIRIVMQELEGWYLGQPDALAACGLISDAVRRSMQKRKFRDPDMLTNAKQEFYRLHGRSYQQIALAQLIGPYRDPDLNRSASFRLFVKTLREFAR